MGGDNPYAPPTTDPEDVPVERRDWFVAGRGIHLKDGSILPRIDLETGGTEAALIPVRRTIAKMKPAVWFANAGITLLVWFLASRNISPAIAGAVAFAYVMISSGLKKFLPHSIAPRVSFTIHQNVKSARFYRIKSNFLPVFEFCSPGLIIVSVIFPLPNLLLIAALVCAGALFFLQKADARLEIRLAEGSDLRARIGNAHPSALRQLLKIQREEEKTPAPDAGTGAL